MNKIKKVLVCFLSFVLVLSTCSLYGFASGNQTIYEVLSSRGYPQYVLYELCEEAKIDILNSESFFEDVEYIEYDENGNVIDNKNKCTALYGQIKESSLKLTIIVGKKVNNEKNVTFNYQWNILPVNRWQDPIAISWNDAYFRLKDNSFHKVDQYDYAIGSDYSKIYSAIKSSEEAYAGAGPNGCMWYADLKGHSTTTPVFSLYGYANFTLECMKSSGSSQIFAKYAHKKATGSLSIGIPKFGSFSITGTSSFDELGTQITVTA